MSMPGFAMNLPGQRARGGNPTAGLIAVVLFVLAGLAVEEGARQGVYAFFALAILLGVIGALVGGFLAQQLRIDLKTGNAFLERLVMSLVGAVVVIVIAGLII